MNNTIYISNTDTSVLSAAVASGYFYRNPVDNSANYYTNTATSMSFNDNTWVQSFSGTTFSGDQLVYKRKTYISSTDFSIMSSGVVWPANTKIYSSFSPVKFNLSGIDDELNPIIQIDFNPDNSVITSINQQSIITYNSNTVNELLNNNSQNIYNPKYRVFEHKFDVDENTKTFFPTFSAYRRDGLIDEYVVPILISKDSVYNVSQKINLLDSQILPLTSYDPMLKVELEQPNYVNNLVIKRSVTPTPTRTFTPTLTRNATPTHTHTHTQTRTRTYSPTRTRTKTHTRTSTYTQTVTNTTLLSPTPSKSTVYFYQPPPSQPPPDEELECESYEYTVTFEGLNDTVDPSTIYIGFIYGNVTKEIYAVQPSKVFGSNSVKVNVPVNITNSLLQTFIYYFDDDPGISILDFQQTNNCSLNAVDKIDRLPKPKIPIPPTLTPTVVTTTTKTNGNTVTVTVGPTDKPKNKKKIIIDDVDEEFYQSVFTFTYDNQIPRLECSYIRSDGREVFQSGNDNNDWSSQYYQIASPCTGKLTVRWFVIRTNLSIAELTTYTKDKENRPVVAPPAEVTVGLDSGVWSPPNVTNVRRDEFGNLIPGRVETSTPFFTPYESNTFNNENLFLWFNVQYTNNRTSFEEQQYTYYKEIAETSGIDACEVLINNFDTSVPPDEDWPEFSTLPPCPAFDQNYSSVREILSIDDWERQGRPTNTIQLFT